jgi:uncharacterized protein
MRSVFVDTVYWIAVVRPSDPWKAAAVEARRALPEDVRLVTSDEVLAEFLAGLSRGGADLRVSASRIVRAILESKDVQVLEQTRKSFLRGISLYQARPDKQYSLVDCASMSSMKSLGIKDVLSNDRHFEQEGFNVLM